MSNSNQLLDGLNVRLQLVPKDVSGAVFAVLDCESSSGVDATCQMNPVSCKSAVDADGRAFRKLQPGTVQATLNFSGSLATGGTGIDVYSLSEDLRKGTEMDFRFIDEATTSLFAGSCRIETTDIQAPDNSTATFSGSAKIISKV